MGQLFDFRTKLEKHIADHNLDEHDVKGKIGLEAGIIVGLLRESTPNDEKKMSKLTAAVEKVLNIQL